MTPHHIYRSRMALLATAALVAGASIAAAAMALSSVSVITNSLRLRRHH